MTTQEQMQLIRRAVTAYPHQRGARGDGSDKEKWLRSLPLDKLWAVVHSWEGHAWSAQNPIGQRPTTRVMTTQPAAIDTRHEEDTTMTGTQLRQVLNGVKGRAGATLSTATREKIDGAVASLQTGVVSIEDATTLLTELLESATPASDSEEARYLPSEGARVVQPAADDKAYLPL